MKAVVLLSGGIDSMACVNFYQQQGYEVDSIFCDYGQPAAKVEYAASKKIAEYFGIPLSIIKTKNIKIPSSGEICGRNALLVFQALCYKGHGTYKIVLGIHDGTGYADCSAQFVRSINRVIDCYSNGTVFLESPLVSWNKAEIIDYCKINKLPLEYTYSCEMGQIPCCGQCLSCMDRKELLHENI